MITYFVALVVTAFGADLPVTMLVNAESPREAFYAAREAQLTTWGTGTVVTMAEVPTVYGSLVSPHLAGMVG